MNNYNTIILCWICIKFTLNHFALLHDCTDPTECQDGVTNNCTQTCARTTSNGTSFYECGCDEGFKLSPDNTTCDGKHVSYMRQIGPGGFPSSCLFAAAPSLFGTLTSSTSCSILLPILTLMLSPQLDLLWFFIDWLSLWSQPLFADAV